MLSSGLGSASRRGPGSAGMLRMSRARDAPGAAPGAAPVGQARTRCGLGVLSIGPVLGSPTYGHIWGEQPRSGALWKAHQELARSCHACPCGVQPHGRFVAAGEGQPGVQGRSQARVFPDCRDLRQGGFGSAGPSAGRGSFKSGSTGGERPPAFTPGVAKGGGPRRP